MNRRIPSGVFGKESSIDSPLPGSKIPAWIVSWCASNPTYVISFDMTGSFRMWLYCLRAATHGNRASSAPYSYEY